MKKYFCLQSKRFWRYFPGAFLAVLILLGGLAAVLETVLGQQPQEENSKFQVGVVGYTDDPFLQMGISALSFYDSSRFSMELKTMTEEEAARAMSLGKLSAYVVVPEGFVDEAMRGNILPLKFVSTVGATGMIALVQTEITDAISRLLLDAQTGMYGMEAAAKDNGQSTRGHMDGIALTYTEYIFLREKTYSLTQLGIGDGLDLGNYLLCGFVVLFLLLSCLPFAPLMIRRSTSLGQMLAARGRSVFWQTVCDFAAYALGLLAMALAVAAIFLLMDEKFARYGWLLIRAIPVVLLAAAFSYMLYSLSTDLTGGVLLQFFATLAMCFVSGCMYPVYFFPARMQQAAAWLPAGVARSQLAAVLTGDSQTGALLAVLGYAAAFFAIGSIATCRRIKGVSR